MKKKFSKNHIRGLKITRFAKPSKNQLKKYQVPNTDLPANFHHWFCPMHFLNLRKYTFLFQLKTAVLMTQHAKHEHELRRLRRKIQVLEMENERLVQLLNNSQAI